MSEETSYFVITGSGDGDICIAEETADSLLKQLNPNEHGDAEIVAANVLETLPDNNMRYWVVGSSFTLIIKGEIIVPKAVEVVTRFEL